ncbi:hypothetical protein ACWD7F_28785 [Streptomyces sp. NPDC005122]
MPTSRLTARAAVAGAALALALGLLMVPAASAARAGSTRTVPSDTYPVTARTDTDVHAGPSTSSPRRGSLRAGHTYPADCWLIGDVVAGDGGTSGVWIHVLGDKDTGDGFVNAVFLQGDAHAGLPASARC